MNKLLELFIPAVTSGPHSSPVTWLLIPTSVAQAVKNPPAMHEMPVFWPGESHGQRSLAGYSPRGHKESDVTEQPSLSVRNLLRGLVIPQGGRARQGDSQQ